MVKSKFITFILISICLVSCANHFDPLPYQIDEDIKETRQYEIIKLFHDGEAGFYKTDGRIFPIYEKNNLKRPAFIHFFAGKNGDEIKLLDGDSELCDSDNDFTLGCSFTCSGIYPTIYKGKLKPVKPFVYKVEGEYDKNYSILDKPDADFYIMILENGELLFYYGDEEYKTIDLKDDTPNYTAYYAEPDGTGEPSTDVCKMRKSR